MPPEDDEDDDDDGCGDEVGVTGIGSLKPVAGLIGGARVKRNQKR